MTEGPGYSPDRLIRGLSLPRRIGYVVAGLGGLSAATMIGLLWATEPERLPARTQIAFAVMIVIGLCWAGFAGWALASRPLFALDRLIAAWLALVFSALMTTGTVAVSLARGSTAGVLTAGGVGLILVGVAGVNLRRALAYRAALRLRSRELNR